MSDLLNSVLEFWVDVILLIPRLIFWSSMEILEVVIGWLNDEFSVDPSIYANSIPADVLYFLTIMQFHVGLPILAAALLARFILRRIPLIG